MSDPKKHVNVTCAHLDLENYACAHIGEGNVPTNPICRECLAGLYMLWKESIWEQAKERNGHLFPHFTYGRAEEAQ